MSAESARGARRRLAGPAADAEVLDPPDANGSFVAQFLDGPAKEVGTPSNERRR